MTSCAVSEEIILEWVIDGQSLESPTQSRALHLRGIFESSREVLSNGVTTSTVTVFGDINVNNSTRLCCRTIVNGDILANCTTVVIYDRPSPPELKIGLTHNGRSEFNLSWTSIATQAGVVQNYTLVFHSYEVKTSENFWIYQPMQPTTKCGTFLAYVKAVNGAGESDPSDNVTIPSLPDIEPVTASLTHQVWKSNGQIMVNVSFEEARYCESDPVLAYNVTLRPQTVGTPIEIAINGNQTEVVLGHDNGVKHDHKYLLSVTATNMVGNATSDMSKVVITSDLQAVSVPLVNEFTLNVQCMFIIGSASLGCSVLVSSYQLNVNSVNATLSRKQGAMYALGHLNLTDKSHCYDRVLAFNIDKHNITSTFSVETELPGRRNTTCSDVAPSPGITVIVSLVLITVIVIIVAIVTAVLIVKKVKINNKGKQVSASAIIDSPAHTLSQKESDSITQCSILQHDDFSSPPLLDTHHITDYTPHSVLPDKNSGEDEVPGDSQSPSKVPIYAVPDKSKKKNVSSDGQRPDQQLNMSSPEDHDESNDKAQHIYHVLENTKGQDSTDKDHDTHNSVLHCLPDKTRMKSNPDNDECVVLSTNSASGNREQKESVQDHIYHVLEQNEVPDAVPLSPSHDAPQLPPPFDPDNFTPAPVYQDITELQTK